MTKRISKLQKAKNLIKKGHSNKYIFDNFPTISRQTVYNARWLINKEKGIATLPKPEAVGQGTGIASSASAIPLQFAIIDRPAKKQSNARRNAQLARRARERKEQAELTEQAMQSIKRERENLKPSGWLVSGVSTGNTSLIERLAKHNPNPVAERTLWQKIKSFFGA